jgi:hypothetical protein
MRPRVFDRLRSLFRRFSTPGDGQSFIIKYATRLARSLSAAEGGFVLQ